MDVVRLVLQLVNLLFDMGILLVDFLLFVLGYSQECTVGELEPVFEVVLIRIDGHPCLRIVGGGDQTHEPVVVDLRNRIVLVVMATGTLQSHTQKCASQDFQGVVQHPIVIVGNIGHILGGKILGSAPKSRCD